MIASYARLLQGGADYQCLRAYAAKPGPDLTPQMATTAFGILNVPNMYHQIPPNSERKTHMSNIGNTPALPARPAWSRPCTSSRRAVAAPRTFERSVAPNHICPAFPDALVCESGDLGEAGHPTSCGLTRCRMLYMLEVAANSGKKKVH